MINCIKKILLENNYQPYHEDDQKMFFVNKVSNKYDYYLIYDLGKYSTTDEIDVAIKDSEDYFADIRKKFVDVDKNTTALYLIDTVDLVITKELETFVCKVEELVEYMKRNVLYYNDKELEFAKKASNEGNFSNKLLKEVKDQKLFHNFKMGKSDKYKYSILAKFFIKLNCFKYDFDKVDGYESLENKIEVALQSATKKLNNNYKSIVDELDKVAEKNNDEVKFYAKVAEIIENDDPTVFETRIKNRLDSIISISNQSTNV